MGRARLGHTRLALLATFAVSEPAFAVSEPAFAVNEFSPKRSGIGHATGSSSPTTGALAFGLPGVVILLLRFTRRAS